jgi:hypothetical protein
MRLQLSNGQQGMVSAHFLIEKNYESRKLNKFDLKFSKKKKRVSKNRIWALI